MEGSVTCVPEGVLRYACEGMLTHSLIWLPGHTMQVHTPSHTRPVYHLSLIHRLPPKFLLHKEPENEATPHQFLGTQLANVHEECVCMYIHTAGMGTSNTHKQQCKFSCHNRCTISRHSSSLHIHSSMCAVCANTCASIAAHLLASATFNLLFSYLSDSSSASGVAFVPLLPIAGEDCERETQVIT